MLNDTDTLGDVLADGDNDTDVEGVTDALKEGESDGERDTLVLGVDDAERLGDNDDDKDTLVLGVDDTDADIEVLADSDPPSTTIAHAADVDVPTFTYVFGPLLSRSRNNAPFLKPEYPDGSVLPSASNIRSVDNTSGCCALIIRVVSYLMTLLY